MKPYYQSDGMTIYHADCREVLPTLEDKSIDVVMTDPPYGHNNNNNNDLIARREKALGKGSPGEARPIHGDGEEATPVFREVIEQVSGLLRRGACCCCCGGGGGPDPQFARWSLILDELIGFKHAVVWDKGGLGMGWHYRRNYEFVLVAQKPGATCTWNGDNNTSNVLRINGLIPSASDHPTPKPVALMQHFIRLHSNRGDLILDPFMGAGTTLVAAKNLGCRAIGIEIDEQWCEKAAKRLAQGVFDFSI